MGGRDCWRSPDQSPTSETAYRCQCADWKGLVGDARRRLVTSSQTESLLLPKLKEPTRQRWTLRDSVTVTRHRRAVTHSSVAGYRASLTNEAVIDPCRCSCERIRVHGMFVGHVSSERRRTCQDGADSASATSLSGGGG
jgi:hypothetical protein